MSVLQTCAQGSSGAASVDIGDAIANSCMFDSASSQYMSKTFGSAGNRRTFTISMWVKRCKLGVTQSLAQAAVGGSEDRISFNSDDTLWVGFNGVTTYVKTSAVYRDTSAWMHIVVRVDTTDATAANRIRLYVNGIETTYASTSYMAQNYDCGWNNAVLHEVGRAAAAQYSDLYIANYVMVDGSSLAPSSFGRTSADTGAWVPKTHSVTYGTNGVWFQFDSAGATVASNTGLGKDSSGNGHYFVTNGSIAAANQYTDTPTNNYTVLNPLDMESGFTLSKGNTKFTTSATKNLRCSMKLPTTGTWYWEATVNAAVGGHPQLGVSQPNYALSTADSQSRFYMTDGNKWNGSSSSAYGASYTTNDVIGFLWDGAAGSLTCYKGTSSQGVMFSGLTGDWVIGLRSSSSGSATFNFGAQAFVNKSSNAPSASALCTANLTAPATPKSTNAFVVSSTTEANIYSQVASDISGWANYVTILKNRSSAENWAWTFSHDSANEYSVAASSLTYQAVRAMSGSDNWVGYSIRIGATYGTAAGSVSHTNGADTTITHNVGVSARQVIFLFSRAAAVNSVLVYHPDLTSGELLDLCTTAADAANVKIKTVTSNSFKIDTSAATATYDYLVLSELNGFCSIGKYTGAGATTDNTFVYEGMLPALHVVKVFSTTGNWIALNTTNNAYNVSETALRLNTNESEATVGTTYDMDMNSNGVKNRASNVADVSAANTYAYFSLSRLALKYATAR